MHGTVDEDVAAAADVSNKADYLAIINNHVTRRRVNFRLNNTETTSKGLKKSQPPNAMLRSVVKLDKSKCRRPNVARNRAGDDASAGSSSSSGEGVVKRGVRRKPTTAMKNVIFNGTFPIDDPFSSRFEGDDDDELLSEQSDDDGRANDDDDEDEYKKDFDGPSQSYSMDRLISDRNIKMNYAKMKDEFQKSFQEFEEYIAAKNRTKNIKTFDIDGPI